MKFGQVVPAEFKKHHDAHAFEITGLLNWVKVLKGDVLTINEDLTPYDVLLTNVSSTENEYISLIRQENPDATIIACFDYGMEAINTYLTSVERIKQVMQRADHVFSVNKNQRAWMKYLLPGRTIHYMPHPTDVENVKKFRRSENQRGKGIAVMWHQYDNYQIQSLEVCRGVERELKRTLTKTLIGLKTEYMKQHGIGTVSANIPVILDTHPDPKLRGRPLDPNLPEVVTMAPPGIGWDMVLPYFGVDSWYSLLSEFDLAIDLYTISSMGRFGIDCAGVGIPAVVSDKQDSSMLYPETTVDPYWPDKAIEAARRLITEDHFRERVMREADKRLHNFGFGESKRRFERIIESKSEAS